MIPNILRIVLLAVLLATTRVVCAAIPPAENLLPADTFVFFTIPDFDALRAAGKVSPQLMFWNDPAMKPFRDKFMDEIDPAISGTVGAESRDASFRFYRPASWSTHLGRHDQWIGGGRPLNKKRSSGGCPLEQGTAEMLRARARGAYVEEQHANLSGYRLRSRSWSGVDRGAARAR